jgi:hypothetical protein
MIRRRALFVTLVASLVPSDATTQESPEALCFRGAPVDQCRRFLVTEVALSYPIVSGPDGQFRSLWDDVAVFGDFGAMLNFGARSALGATAGFGWTGAAYMALKARVRYWASPVVGVDVAPGLVVLNRGVDVPQWSVDASLMFEDRIGLTAQALAIEEQVCVGDTGPVTCTTGKDWQVNLGIRAGSELGASGATLGAAGFLAFLGLVAILL